MAGEWPRVNKRGKADVQNLPTESRLGLHSVLQGRPCFPEGDTMQTENQGKTKCIADSLCLSLYLSSLSLSLSLSIYISIYIYIYI